MGLGLALEQEVDCEHRDLRTKFQVGIVGYIARLRMVEEDSILDVHFQHVNNRLRQW